MSCTAYIVYTFHLSLYHTNFGQFKAKQVLLLGEFYFIFLFRVLKCSWLKIATIMWANVSRSDKVKGSDQLFVTLYSQSIYLCTQTADLNPF